MAQKAVTRTILTRCVAVLALLFAYGAYLVGATVLMTASSTPAQARRHWRGRGVYGRGRYWGGYPYYGYSAPYYVAPGPRCYWSRRWRRTICRW